MTAAEVKQQDATAEEVLRWRFEQLVQAGYSKREARLISARMDVDLHQAVDLIAGGCPNELALSILL
jgi:hypothetical protein